MEGTSAIYSFLMALTIAASATAAARAQPATQERRGQHTAYISWLEKRSMLYQARAQAREISGSGVQWRHPYGDPQPHEAVKTASVWLLDYPGSVIIRPGKSVLATWGKRLCHLRVGMQYG